MRRFLIWRKNADALKSDGASYLFEKPLTIAYIISLCYSQHHLEAQFLLWNLLIFHSFSVLSHHLPVYNALERSEGTSYAFSHIRIKYVPLDRIFARVIETSTAIQRMLGGKARNDYSPEDMGHGVHFSRISPGCCWISCFHCRPTQQWRPESEKCYPLSLLRPILVYAYSELAMANVRNYKPHWITLIRSIKSKMHCTVAVSFWLYSRLIDYKKCGAMMNLEWLNFFKKMWPEKKLIFTRKLHFILMRHKRDFNSGRCIISSLLPVHRSHLYIGWCACILPWIGTIGMQKNWDPLLQD